MALILSGANFVVRFRLRHSLSQLCKNGLNSDKKIDTHCMHIGTAYISKKSFNVILISSSTFSYIDNFLDLMVFCQSNFTTKITSIDVNSDGK